jgi:hypothetical protein
MTAAATQGLSLAVRDSLARVTLAGLAGGVVDVYPTGMALSKGRPWDAPWQAVASGWIGKAARDGGLASTGLGIVTHFGIALAMAAAYALVARRFPVLYRRWWLCAVPYGAILYLVMNRIVLPLRWPGAGGWRGVESAYDVVAHLGVALAIAWVLSRAAKPS